MSLCQGWHCRLLAISAQDLNDLWGFELRFPCLYRNHKWLSHLPAFVNNLDKKRKANNLNSIQSQIITYFIKTDLLAIIKCHVSLLTSLCFTVELHLQPHYLLFFFMLCILKCIFRVFFKKKNQKTKHKTNLSNVSKKFPFFGE